MKRSLPLLLGLFALCPILSHAQLRIAVIGGPHTSKIIETNNIPGWDSTTKPGYSGRKGFHAGVLIDVPLGQSQRWFLQPGIVYHNKGRNYQQWNDSTGFQSGDTISLTRKFSPNYIDIPFNLAYKLPLGSKARLVLSAGPYISMFYNGESTLESRIYPTSKFESSTKKIETGKETGKVKTLEFGLNARAGIELGKLLVAGYFSRGLTNFYAAPYEGKFHHQVVGLTAGLYLNRPSDNKVVVKDQDKDGIPDDKDGCPSLSGTELTGGCPDTDADGIADKDDRCPTVAGLALYAGCPVPDRDKDGINDEQDKCPDQFGDIQFNGCPIPDTDGDGINDLEDKCPQEKGIATRNGCPEPAVVTKEITRAVNIAAKQILFETNSDRLTDGSYEAIGQVVQYLKDNPSWTLSISGYTDNVGNDQANLELSRRRALAVKQALEAEGIGAERITAEGFGESSPIGDNNTAEGRKLNRRVELKIEHP